LRWRQGCHDPTRKICSEDLTEKDANHTDERATEVREHLANERTLLSWVRTGVGLISLGIVVEREQVRRLNEAYTRWAGNRRDA
jgi:uncharacterized membrane protein YidH (DUF202 family)